MGSASSMPAVRVAASRTSPPMSCASGRLRQYYFGISFCIAATFSRAGLKMDA